MYGVFSGKPFYCTAAVYAFQVCLYVSLLAIYGETVKSSNSSADVTQRTEYRDDMMKAPLLLATEKGQQDPPGQQENKPTLPEPKLRRLPGRQ